MKKHVIFGPPGTGKTTRLIALVERELAFGVPPEAIAFVSFSKRAAQEAIDRACARFGFPPERFRYFRTIHSLCFHELGLSRNQVIGPAHLAELAKETGLRFSSGAGGEEQGELRAGTGEGDKALRILQLARLRRYSAEDAWAANPDDNISLHLYRHIVDAYSRYKAANGLMDFTDMLEHFVQFGLRVPVQVAIIDEAQDLSQLQWDVVFNAFYGAERMYIAGDDDQAIYAWAGASVSTFLSVAEGADTVEVLEKSYRLPRRVWQFASDISSQIAQRKPKVWGPREEDGTVEHIANLNNVLPQMSSGTWLLLLRNVHTLPGVAMALHEAGLLYRVRGQPSINAATVAAIRLWERHLKSGDLSPEDREVLEDFTSNIGDARHWYEAFDRVPAARREYFRACLRNGEDLTAEPRIAVETIHSTKGAEADNVVLFPDYTNRVHKGTAVDPDAEHRVWYVGATRARQRLFLMWPSTSLYYRLPSVG